MANDDPPSLGEPNRAGGKLAANILYFARLLRSAGLPVGPGQILEAIDAAAVGGLKSRHDFYWTLHCIFVKRHEHSELFEQAFHVFWRKPKMIQQLMQLLLHQIARQTNAGPKQPGFRRLSEALFEGAHSPRSHRESPPGEIEIETTLSFSPDEILRRKDFEQMTVQEQIRARHAIAQIRFERFEVPTRRFAPNSHGQRIDFRRTMQSSIRSGGNLIDLDMRRRKWKEPPIVALCDISGSMAGYSRMFLHFLHAFMERVPRGHVFLFGTRLTNVTREMKHRDPDEAIRKVAETVRDWSGGTRIGSSIKAFNFLWARRVLNKGAVVILMTDGLDREDVAVLDREMARLHRLTPRLIWLNPLLRFAEFEARAKGVKTMMPHVDEFRPVHNLISLEDIAKALTEGESTGRSPRNWSTAAKSA